MTRYTMVNPKFIAWYDEQDEETRAKVDQFYDATGEHDDIVPDGQKRQYARLHRTLEFARDTYGYEFTA